MVVVMAPEATQEDVDVIVDLVRAAGGEAFVSRGVSRTIVGLVGDVDEFGALNLRSRNGVLDVVRISVPYKLISREHHPDRSVISVGGVPIGPDTLTVIAGPCAVETPEQTLAAARMARAAGASLLRGGAFKPRTSPYAYQGLGEAGLKILADVRAETGLPVVTEVIDPGSVDLVCSYADMLQVGTRNMQNFALLQAVGSAAKPVLLKRGMSATVEEWLMAAEYIAQRGNLDIVLCERGIRTFETATRNTLDISAVPVAQRLSHLPVIVNPSHSGGQARPGPPAHPGRDRGRRRWCDHRRAPGARDGPVRRRPGAGGGRYPPDREHRREPVPADGPYPHPRPGRGERPEPPAKPGGRLTPARRCRGPTGRPDIRLRTRLFAAIVVLAGAEPYRASRPGSERDEVAQLPPPPPAATAGRAADHDRVAARQRHRLAGCLPRALRGIDQLHRPDRRVRVREGERLGGGRHRSVRRHSRRPGRRTVERQELARSHPAQRADRRPGRGEHACPE